MHIGNSQVLLKKFEEKYPFIKTTLFRATSEKVLNKIMTEALAGRSFWDAINLTLFEVELIKSKGWLQRYDSPENKFFSKEHVDPNRHWTDVYDNTLVIAYNKNMVPPRDLPKKWEDLLEKRWKGQIVLDEGDYLWFAIMMQVMGEEKGMRYMQDLSRNQTQLRDGHNLINVLIGAGEFPLGLTYGHLAEHFMDKGAPINWVGLQPVPVDLHPVAIGKNAPNPNAAKLFYDYLLSEEGQKLIPVAPELAPKYGKYVNQFDSIFKK
jgi:iron(III) transport system substrate-binding protein